jgi:hypothetical protein
MMFLLNINCVANVEDEIFPEVISVFLSSQLFSAPENADLLYCSMGMQGTFISHENTGKHLLFESLARNNTKTANMITKFFIVYIPLERMPSSASKESLQTIIFREGYLIIQCIPFCYEIHLFGNTILFIFPDFPLDCHNLPGRMTRCSRTLTCFA